MSRIRWSKKVSELRWIPLTDSLVLSRVFPLHPGPVVGCRRAVPPTHSDRSLGSVESGFPDKPQIYTVRESFVGRVSSSLGPERPVPVPTDTPGPVGGRGSEVKRETSELLSSGRRRLQTPRRPLRRPPPPRPPLPISLLSFVDDVGALVSRRTVVLRVCRPGLGWVPRESNSEACPTGTGSKGATV